MTPSPENSAPEVFELSGGALCLDFANTWGNQLDPESDRLTSYGRLLVFANEAGYLTGETANSLAAAAGIDRDRAAAAFSTSLELRQVIYRLFSSRVGGRAIAAGDVAWINTLLGDALSHRRLEHQDGELMWSWADTDSGDLRAPLWPIIESAASLLTSGEIDRVRECDAEDCNWLFLDNSRARTRRWCSMSSCGNRAKARRYYQRQQAEGTR